MNIAKNIRKARMKAKMTMTELAAECDVWKSCISRIESGIRTPSLRMLEILAAALDVNVTDLTK